MIVVSGGVVSVDGEGFSLFPEQLLLPEQLVAGWLRACGPIRDEAAKPSRLLGSMEMERTIIPRKIIQNSRSLFIFIPP
ncbi:MAG: hypothetical protein NT056_06195, partial [Proteobacteria bacterium]|nr:hypothetical protein [Pseudomonadota bacterium]